MCRPSCAQWEEHCGEARHLWVKKWRVCMVGSAGSRTPSLLGWSAFRRAWAVPHAWEVQSLQAAANPRGFSGGHPYCSSDSAAWQALGGLACLGSVENPCGPPSRSGNRAILGVAWEWPGHWEAARCAEACDFHQPRTPKSENHPRRLSPPVSCCCPYLNIPPSTSHLPPSTSSPPRLFSPLLHTCRRQPINSVHPFDSIHNKFQLRHFSPANSHLPTSDPSHPQARTSSTPPRHRKTQHTLALSQIPIHHIRCWLPRPSARQLPTLSVSPPSGSSESALFPVRHSRTIPPRPRPHYCASFSSPSSSFDLQQFHKPSEISWATLCARRTETSLQAT